MYPPGHFAGAKVAVAEDTAFLQPSPLGLTGAGHQFAAVAFAVGPAALRLPQVRQLASWESVGWLADTQLVVWGRTVSLLCPVWHATWPSAGHVSAVPAAEGSSASGVSRCVALGCAFVNQTGICVVVVVALGVPSEPSSDGQQSVAVTIWVVPLAAWATVAWVPS